MLFVQNVYQIVGKDVSVYFRNTLVFPKDTLLSHVLILVGQ